MICDIGICMILYFVAELYEYKEQQQRGIVLISPEVTVLLLKVLKDAVNIKNNLVHKY